MMPCAAWTAAQCAQLPSPDPRPCLCVRAASPACARAARQLPCCARPWSGARPRASVSAGRCCGALSRAGPRVLLLPPGSMCTPNVHQPAPAPKQPTRLDNTHTHTHHHHNNKHQTDSLEASQFADTPFAQQGWVYLAGNDHQGRTLVVRAARRARGDVHAAADASSMQGRASPLLPRCCHSRVHNQLHTHTHTHRCSASARTSSPSTSRRGT
jgi:hypothetical protein